MERTLLLQCVLTGRAQLAYASLSVADSQVYNKVKTAVLKAYELVPEAYRFRFRNMRKMYEQTNVDFMRALTLQFTRRSENITTLDELVDLFLLEQYKNTLFEGVATYIVERKVRTASEAAVLADEWELTHRSRVDRTRMDRGNFRSWPNVTPVPQAQEQRSAQRYQPVQKPPQTQYQTPALDKDACGYCFAKGHWMRQCPVLQAKKAQSFNTTAGASILAAPVPAIIDLEFPTDRPACASACVADRD